jgi:uncharacterized PurR-regulated membrane protein YhhQ (DUF165 family)
VTARLATAAALVATVVVANALTARYGLVPAGFGLLVTAGTYAAGLALALRDALDRLGGLRWVLGTVAVGVALSAWLASPALAVASAVAFGCGELVDLAVWRQLQRRSTVAAIAGSNLAGAVVDSLVFLPLAGFGVSATAVGGQVLVKAGWITAAAILVAAAVGAVRARQVVA